jgi:predicted TIM-barrel fold metal-dependent hydrolase
MGPNQLVLGSDFPHQIGSLERSITSIEALDLPEKEKVFGENGVRLLKLE